MLLPAGVMLDAVSPFSPKSPWPSNPVARPRVDGTSVLRVEAWEAESWLLHGFSTRSPSSGRAGDGEFNLGYTPGALPELIRVNRERYLGALSSTMNGGGRGDGLVTLKQMHSALVRKVGHTDVSVRASLWGDGLLTESPGVLLGIQTADCFPILLADKRLRVVAAVHAGWRGTLKGIAALAVGGMRHEFGSKPEDLLAAIGPGIGPCCFAVGPEVRQLFRGRFRYADELFSSEPKPCMDLAAANRRQLLDAGIPDQAIARVGGCTSCEVHRFFSYRAEQGKTGRMLAVIGIARE